MLKLSEKLSLPREAVTETFAVLGMRGSGKTNFGVVLVEELVGAELPVAVIDPVGVWWGLRLGPDGKKKGGLDVTIIGGEHGDVPLEESSGKVLAEFLVETRRPCVLDLSGLRKGASVRFMTDFAETLYHLHASKREALHLVVDEADAYAPQRTGPEGARLLGAMEDLIRRGRSRGIGMTLITQRPAVLNKNVLTQASALVVFRLVGPHDRKAIDEWVSQNAETEEQRAQVESTLPGLTRGDAWVWSPGWLELFKRVHVRARRTFDSSATPKPGQGVVHRELAPVDLEGLKARLAATIERVKENDPKVLRGRVAELERELAKGKERVVEQRVEVPVIPETLMHAVSETLRALDRCKNELVTSLAACETIGAHVKSAATSAKNGSARPALMVKAPTAIGLVTEQVRRERSERHEAGGQELGGGERKILTVLAQHADGLSKVQVAILTGYSHSSGGFRNYLGALRSSGRIEGGGDRMRITEKGLRELGAYEPLPTGRELLAYWLSNAGGKCERMILAEVADQHPRALPKEAIANRTGYQATSGGFRNALGKLRTLQLISGRGDLRLSPALAEAIGGA